MSEAANDYHWRNSMRTARFFMFDARSVLGIVLVILHIRMWTFMLALAVMTAFWMAERAGYDFNASLRRIRSFIIGPKRPATAWSRGRRLKDYGR